MAKTAYRSFASSQPGRATFVQTFNWNGFYELWQKVLRTIRDSCLRRNEGQQEKAGIFALPEQSFYQERHRAFRIALFLSLLSVTY